jgi:predicted anti-sigma-YlaC factor YlaD
MKQLLSTYSISGNVVTLTGVNRPKEAILAISDATTGAVLYSAQTGGATAYTQATNSTITLSTTPGSTDRLQIFYDDGVAASPAPSSVSVSNFPATQPVTPSAGDLTSGNQTTKIVNGSNTLAVDSNGALTANNAVSASYTYSQAGVIAINTILVSFACSQYRTVTTQLTAIGTSGVITAEISNDNVNWTAVACFLTVNNPSTTNSTISSVGTYYSQTFGAAYFRLRLSTATTAGTTTLAVQASGQIYAPSYLSGTFTLGAVLQNNPAPANLTGYQAYHSLISAASTNATSVKTSTGILGTVVLTNTASSFRYVKVFNKASAPTVGTDTPVIQFPVAPNSSLDVSTSMAGLRLTTGIAYAITGASALLDTTSVAAGDVLVNLTYY